MDFNNLIKRLDKLESINEVNDKPFIFTIPGKDSKQLEKSAEDVFDSIQKIRPDLFKYLYDYDIKGNKIIFSNMRVYDDSIKDLIKGIITKYFNNNVKFESP